MKLEDKQILIDSVRNADMVLVGIGEEWGIPFEKMLSDHKFATNFAKLETEETKERLVPILQREYLKQIHDKELQNAYNNLIHLLEDKNYFVVSMNKDRYPILSGLKQEKCVFPCGGYEQFQCDNRCSEELFDAAEQSEALYQRIEQSQDIRGIRMPLCPICKKEMVYNNMEAAQYVEAGYLPSWEYYMKWLQGTVNKKLCLLELGVSMRFPSVIRWPFEKTTYYNQKAEMFRIHHSLSQSMENIADRCYSCDENSVAYMAKLFVS